MSYTLQKNSLLKISAAPLKAVEFDGLDFTGKETLSEPFSFTLTGRTFKGQIPFEKIIGQEIGVTLCLGGNSTRDFHGHVGAIEQLQTPIPPGKEGSVPEGHVYKIAIYPLFGLLKHTQDCRIFQNLSALDIVKKVLGENKIIFADKTKQCGKKVREFCVQYNESHFHFVSRLLEEEGIFYFFTHTASEHRLILADDLDVFQKIPAPKEVIFGRASNEEPWVDRLWEFKKYQQVVPQALSLIDFYFETPDKALYTKRRGTDNAVPGEVYTYPGQYTTVPDGEDLVKLRLQATEFQAISQKGTSTVPALYSGAKFQLKNHPDPAMDALYVIYDIAHHLEWKEQSGQMVQSYTNDFFSFSDKIPFRPLQKTPKPRILSMQTAVVTGKAGEEIWTDAYGRVKVRFHWDRHGKSDETSSCWMRVSYPLAGQGWGFLSTPRIGQEVVISFINGDPDRPLVVGCVYNGLHKPPYPQEQATKSTFKSNSSKGGEGFNEFRFEDKKNEEEVYLHAQKDAKVVVEDSRTTDINTGSCTTLIHRGDRRVTLNAEDKPTNGKGDDALTLAKGSRTVELQAKGSGQGNLTTTLHKGDDTLLIKKGDHIITLEKGDETISLRKGDRTVSITGDDTLKISRGNLSVSVTSGNISVETTGNETHKVQGNLNFNVTGSINLKATGGVNISGTGGVKIDGSVGGVKVDGLTVKVSSSTMMDLSAGALMNIKGILVNLN